MIQIKKFTEKELTQESLQSEKEIRMLSRKLIPELAKGITGPSGWIFDDSKEEQLSQIDIRPFYLSRVAISNLSYVYRSTFLKPFYDWLEDKGNFEIKVIIGKYNKNYDGVYLSRENTIELVLNMRRTKEILSEILKAENDRGWSNERKVIKVVEEYFSGSLISTLTHELTHAYDDFVSEGKYINSKYVTPEAGGYDKYAQQNIEVNARYAELIQRLEKTDTKYLYPFDDFIDIAKDTFSGWKILDREQQERLIQRLYKYYNEPIDRRKVKRILPMLSTKELLQQTINIADGKQERYREASIFIPPSLDGIVDNNRVDIESIAKSIINELIKGTYNKEVFKSFSMLRNYYRVFSTLKHTVEQNEHLRDKIAEAQRNGKEDVEALFSNLLKENNESLERFKKALDISDDDIQIIVKRFK